VARDEVHVATQHGDVPERLGDRAPFAARALEKLAPRGRVVEQAMHLHGGAATPRDLLHARDHAARAAYSGAHAVLERRLEHKLRDGGNGRQCFTAKAEAGHPDQVGRGGDLAGGVPLEREHGIVASHAAAVIGDANEGATTVLDVHLDGGRARVERVLDQLLHDGRRSLHHFTGSDLVGDGPAEHANA
jgi:hypothetical protein